jgi:hypothetical protein
MSIAASSMLGTERGEEAVEIGLGAPLAAHPHRTSTLEVAHHDAVVVALTDRDLVDADGPWRGHPGALDLLLHVDLVEVLHRGLVQVLQLGDRLVGHLTAERAHVHRVRVRPPDRTGERSLTAAPLLPGSFSDRW